MININQVVLLTRAFVLFVVYNIKCHHLLFLFDIFTTILTADHAKILLNHSFYFCLSSCPKTENFKRIISRVKYRGWCLQRYACYMLPFTPHNISDVLAEKSKGALFSYSCKIFLRPLMLCVQAMFSVSVFYSLIMFKYHEKSSLDRHL